MWAFAGIRGGPFPLKLVSLYSAFFILSALAGYLVKQETIPFSAQVVFQAILICALYDEANEGRHIRAVNRLCYSLFCFMALIMYSYALHTNYDLLHYQTQNTLLNIHNLLSVILELYVIWLLVEIIDGARGDPIYTRILSILTYGFSIFAPNSESFHYQEEIKGLSNA